MMLELLHPVGASSRYVLDVLVPPLAAGSSGGGGNSPEPVINVLLNNSALIIVAVITTIGTWVVARLSKKSDASPPPVSDADRAAIAAGTAYLEARLKDAEEDIRTARAERDQAIQQRDKALLNHEQLLNLLGRPRESGGTGPGATP